MPQPLNRVVAPTASKNCNSVGWTDTLPEGVSVQPITLHNSIWSLVFFLTCELLIVSLHWRLHRFFFLHHQFNWSLRICSCTLDKLSGQWWDHCINTFLCTVSLTNTKGVSLLVSTMHHSMHWRLQKWGWAAANSRHEDLSHSIDRH